MMNVWYHAIYCAVKTKLFVRSITNVKVSRKLFPQRLQEEVPNEVLLACRYQCRSKQNPFGKNVAHINKNPEG